MIPGIPQTLKELAHDSRFIGTPALAIWIVCAEHLDYVELNELKASLIERELRISISTATKYLDALVDAGFLLRDERRNPNEVYRYRVPATRIRNRRP